MTIDHIYYFGCSLTDMPEIMTLIGRIAAPIFVFFVTEGFVHTHSRGRYLLRLYIGGVLMQIGNLFVNICFPMQNGVIVLNGIFTTMAVMMTSAISLSWNPSSPLRRSSGTAVYCISDFLHTCIIVLFK